ncbi:HvfX family Cu-binding RiPP maturation protein [Pseudomonas mosselii]|uniref:DoxX family protein n=1 Tax=Pseudomonas mosselii TaxID=78327 RepID=A0A1E2TK47_9PSED|nr:DoxX family protein [Pseudomonas mosselii]AMK30571.1 DoxX family protein [Pseudomonas putida]MBA6067958.1 DoxX family protein [Pseudomonas mosselii]MBC3450349.1 DoxX family protein [Pseudomonas mosselii]MBC3457710.1 DoxX family protein [Pseudomonas mosselii]MCH7419977.1 DoxX family protein [Pseudomonas mosselii]
MKALPLFTDWKLFNALDHTGNWSADLPLRLFLAWEFFESGLEKFNGTNWFADLQSSFPFPFNLLPVGLNWQLSMWAELICPLLLLLGLGTRLASAVLMVVTVVAIAAVHWPSQWSSLAELGRGYAITDQGFGNFKLPLIYLVALLPLLLKGAGRLSLDHWLRRYL